MKTTWPVALAAALALAGCMQEEMAATGGVSMEALKPALDAIDGDDLLRRIEVLSADSMEGRSPGTVGEDRAVAYIQSAFEALGLEPGNPDGTYVQEVPLVGLTPTVTASLTIGGRRVPLRGPDELMARTTRITPEVDVLGSELVFVGYGVVAPEYGWDDYKDVDVTGKTLVMLVNDPPVPDPADSTLLDPSMFKGRAMTYYGRWTYKYEVAAEKGAAAAIIIHETGPAGYPFEVLSSGWQREDFDIRSSDDNMSRVAVQAWIPEPTARRVLRATGHDFDALKRAARSKDFRPVELDATADFTIEQAIREVRSRNVIGKLEGATRPDEYVVYTAHWDHLGTDPSLEGDQIFNGARDNASGTAGLMELARAFESLPTPPSRSILFLAVTAEERGLLGSKYYAENPLYPLDHTLAEINMDELNIWGATDDVVVVGLGNSTLDDVLAQAADNQGRTLKPDAEPEKGFYYRSDHFEFAKQGVPALYAESGVDFVGKPEGYGLEKRAEWDEADYHKPSDEVTPEWDLSGAVRDLRLLFQLGYRVSETTEYPSWKPGTEFKTLRDSMMAAKAER